MTFAKKYDHTTESDLYAFWEKNNLFHPETVLGLQSITVHPEAFVMPLPPPNVTGTLHVGHGLMIALQDALVRHARMSGKYTLWIPGTDHAGISTQVVVEKNLKLATKQTKHDVGRTQFTKMLWDFALQSRNGIIGQSKSLGASLDRSREQFTLSEKLSRAVRKSFSNLFADGHITQGTYITNRCTSCQTVLSDVEVEKIPTASHIYTVRYFLSGSGSLDVATTRPETIFADVALAVHPDDKRYQKYIGRMAIVPILNRSIPIIADESVDRSFGTGVLKITPAHDQIDYEIGLRHRLPLTIAAIDKNGLFTELCGNPFAGRSVHSFFNNLIEELKSIDNLVDTQPHESALPQCERCHTVIQPLVSQQRFVDVKSYAHQAIAAVEDSQIEIYPERFKPLFTQRLHTIRPRCISRQLWRGHRIPVRYDAQGTPTVIDEDRIIAYFTSSQGFAPSLVLLLIVFNLFADSRLPSIFAIDDLIQVVLSPCIVPADGLVRQVYLNTYRNNFAHNPAVLKEIDQLSQIFSSLDLSHLSTADQSIDQLITRLEQSPLIRPKNNHYEIDLEKLTGMSGLVQDEDVLDTWFSSALWPFSSLGRPDDTSDLKKFYPMQLLETADDIMFFWVARMVMMGFANMGQIPFRAVYFHGVVTDENGQKMSKSKGTGIDPLEIIKTKGADALRLSLVTGTTPGQKSNLSHTKIDYSYRFINKLRNATRYIHTKIIGDEPRTLDYATLVQYLSKPKIPFDEFDQRILGQLSTLIERQQAVFATYTIGEYCSELVDFVRHDLCDRYIEIAKTQSSPHTDQILLYVLGSILKLLHPYIPFVTERLWNLTGFEGSLSISGLALPIHAGQATSHVQLFRDVVTEFRNLRQQAEIKPHEKVAVFVSANTKLLSMLQTYRDFLLSAIGASDMVTVPTSVAFDDAGYQTAVIYDIKIGIKSDRPIDRKAQMMKLESQLISEQAFLQDQQAMLSNQSFVSKAPAHVLAAKQLKVQEIKDHIALLMVEIDRIQFQHNQE